VKSEDSGFKMFKAPYEFPDSKSLIGAIMIGVKEQENVLGPVFSARVIEYALQFLSGKIGGAPPESIENLDQLAEYLVSIADRYPTPNSALIYAQAKAENDLQGRVGATSRFGEIGFRKRFVEESNVEKKNIDLEGVIVNLVQTAIDAKFSPKEFGYRVNENETVDFLIPECFHKDGCRLAFKEGLLSRPDGRMQCSIISFLCQYFKLFTGYEWDYDCLEFDKPHCKLGSYML